MSALVNGVRLRVAILQYEGPAYAAFDLALLVFSLKLQQHVLLGNRMYLF